MKKLLFLTMLFAWIVTGRAYCQTNQPMAKAVMKQALAQAAAQHKYVMVIFHASWCGWCRKMEASLNDSTCKKMFDDNYVIVTLDVMERAGKTDLENPGAMDIMKKYNGEKAGLPFWVILNTKGNLLADSEIRPAGTPLTTPGDNMGCPAAETEVAYFTKLLESTSALTEEQLAIIGKRFIQNKPVAKAATN